MTPDIRVIHGHRELLEHSIAALSTPLVFVNKGYLRQAVDRSGEENQGDHNSIEGVPKLAQHVTHAIYLPQQQ